MKKFLKSKDFQVWFGMIIGSIIYSFGIVFILDLGQFYASGVTGTAQIITAFLQKTFNNGNTLVGVKSAFIIGINLPLFLIGWRGVSKRFAFVSLGSVLLQTGVIAIFEYIQVNYGSPFAGLDILTLAIIGGLVTGVGGGICLKNGASTGGMDILTQFLSLKKKVSFSKFTLIVDLVIIALAYVVSGGMAIAVYTVVRMIVYVIALDRLHTIYNYVKVSIVTEDVEGVREALLAISNHAITIYKAEGGYSRKEKYVLETIISSFETFEVGKAAKGIDPQCFIVHTAIKKVEGKFNVNTIA